VPSRFPDDEGALSSAPHDEGPSEEEGNRRVAKYSTTWPKYPWDTGDFF